MRKSKEKKFSENCTDLAVIFLESFKTITQFSDDELLDYMNKNNVWSLFNDDMLVSDLAEEGINDTIEIIGRYLPRNEQNNIILRYYSNIRKIRGENLR